MPDEAQTVTGTTASTGDPTPQASTTHTDPPASAPTHTPAQSGMDWDRLEQRLTAFGEQMVSGIREAFPAPQQTPPPANDGGNGGGNSTDDKSEPKSEPKEHPAPGEHGGTKLAAWWFGSKR